MVGREKSFCVTRDFILTFYITFFGITPLNMIYQKEKANDTVGYGLKWRNLLENNYGKKCQIA